MQYRTLSPKALLNKQNKERNNLSMVENPNFTCMSQDFGFGIPAVQRPFSPLVAEKPKLNAKSMHKSLNFSSLGPKKNIQKNKEIAKLKNRLDELEEIRSVNSNRFKS